MTWILSGDVKVHQEGAPYMSGQLRAGDCVEVRSQADGTFGHERRIAELEKELEDEQADMAMIVGEVSKVYDEITGGRFSKPNTAAVYVIEAAEKYAGQEAAEYRALVRALVTSSHEDGIVFFHRGTSVSLNDLTDAQTDLILTALDEVDDDA